LLGQEFVRTVLASDPDTENIVALGGTPGNPMSAYWIGCAEKEIAGVEGKDIVATEYTNWTQEGTFSVASALLARFGKVDAYMHEYADGFRGAIRAYEAAGAPYDFTLVVRGDEQGLFCDWEATGSDDFNIFYGSANTFQSRVALTAAMMDVLGEAGGDAVGVPTSFKEVTKGLCNPDLPQEVPLSTLIDTETLQAMFAE